MRRKPDFWTGVERICWLCLLMEEFIGTNSLEYAPLIMSGMASIMNAPKFKKARQAIFNLRQICPDYTTKQSIRHAVEVYREDHYQKKTQGTYEINPENLEFKRVDPLEDSRIAQAREILTQPLEYEKHSIKFANPHQEMAISLSKDPNFKIPIAPITAPLHAPETHQINRLPKGKIRIPLAELKELAIEMDLREAEYPEKRLSNWEKRFDRFSLMVPEIGQGLKEETILELSEIKHLIGLPGSGKTTILILLAVWLGKHGYKAIFLFPSIEVARQYMVELQFHGIKVGMLVGQSEQTRVRHADKIAETIAAADNSNLGGFGNQIEGAEVFGLNCLLPAFSNADTSMWGFGEAPCQEIFQKSDGKNREMKNYLCPVWTMCGRNKAPRDLLNADIWVGHVLSMDTHVPPQAIQEKIRYFELIARTFDVVVFDEADMVQSNLDDYGAATLSISGSEDSIHYKILEQIHNRFARGNNYRLRDRDVERYSRDLADFGIQNTSLITTVLHKSDSGISEKYADRLLTVRTIISELLDTVEKIKRDDLDEAAIQQRFRKVQDLTDFWSSAAYKSFFDRTTRIELQEWSQSEKCAKNLGIKPDRLAQKWLKIIDLFRMYLAENSLERRDKVLKEIAELFFGVCCMEKPLTPTTEDIIILLVCVTFVIIGYQSIVPGTRSMVAEGLIREPIVESTATPEMRKIIPENILGSFSGVKYSFRKADSNWMKNARNVQISYITFIGTPRMLMHHFHKLLEAEGHTSGPAVLMTSATSFLEASPAYHINVRPDYLLKPRELEHNLEKTSYHFSPIFDSEKIARPLRYSGGGDLRNRNLEKMVKFLVEKGDKSEIYKAIRILQKEENATIPRKAALVVNSYQQARDLKNFLNRHHTQISKRTKAVVDYLHEGEKPADFVTSAQCEALGDDENCDIIIFPLLAIGRGVNIVFTKGERKLDAAIGLIYFLTRPHPTMDDTQLLYSLAGRATQEFDSKIFAENDDLAQIQSAWNESGKQLRKRARRLLREPLMASRLDPELFEAFTANQMVAILQAIGRGMRNGCPVKVYFVDAAWAIKSTEGKPDSGRYSMLVQMRIILEKCMKDPDPVKKAIYQELYSAFLKPLRGIKEVYPDDLQISYDDLEDDADADDYDSEYD